MMMLEPEGTPKEVFSKPEVLRKVHLRLPRVAHLMEILENVEPKN